MDDDRFTPLDSDALLDALRGLVGTLVRVRVELVDRDEDVWLPLAEFGGTLLAVNTSPLDAPPGSNISAWDVWVGDPDDSRHLRIGRLGTFQVTPRRVSNAYALPDGHGVMFEMEKASITVEASRNGGVGW